MDLHEELIEFDPVSHRLAYQVSSGLPAMIRSAVNHWFIEDNGDGTSTVTSKAELRIAWYMTPMIPVMMSQMQRDIAKVCEELQHRIEHGSVHPRKASSITLAATP